MNTLEIYKLLEQSNCGKCGERTCLAFAAAVFKSQRSAGECPQLSLDAIAQITGTDAGKNGNELDLNEYMKKLQSEISHLDLALAAERTGGWTDGNRLTLKVMGKDFTVESNGDLAASIHINHWVTVPFLNYVLHSAGKEISGKWMSYRELRDGRERYPLFQKRCEEPMKRVADSYASLFDNMVHILGGEQVEKQFESDISVVLRPLPKVPVMICYWMPDDGLESGLNVFFDESANDNLDIGSVFMLGVGLSQMFGKIAQTHGFSGVQS